MEPPKLPVIIVSDWSATPRFKAHSILYVRGDHELDTEYMYKSISALRLNIGRGVVKFDETGPIVRACTEGFLEHYWDLFARVIDYFADFAIFDNRMSQVVWFHLLDVLQDVAAVLPHRLHINPRLTCDHASEFIEQYTQTLKLVVHVITNKPPTSPIMDKIVRVNFDLTQEPVGAEGWISGLKPWQQFLCNGSPGLRVPKKDLVYDKDDPLVPYLADKAVATQVHIPPAAIGLIAKHTKRLREATRRLLRKERPDENEAHALAEFDQKSFRPGESFSYTSMTGRTTYVQPMHPSRTNKFTPKTYQGWGDPAFIKEEPELYLLDECVAAHTGQPPIPHPRGAAEFHMCTVTTLQGEDQVPDGVKPVLPNLGETFDDWKVRDNVKTTAYHREGSSDTSEDESDQD